MTPTSGPVSRHGPFQHDGGRVTVTVEPRRLLLDPVRRRLGDPLQLFRIAGVVLALVLVIAGGSVTPPARVVLLIAAAVVFGAVVLTIVVEVAMTAAGLVLVALSLLTRRGRSGLARGVDDLAGRMTDRQPTGRHRRIIGRDLLMPVGEVRGRLRPRLELTLPDGALVLGAQPWSAWRLRRLRRALGA